MKGESCKIAEVPDYSSISEQLSHIYEPSDDTFLFLDALLKEKETILSSDPTVCVELGSGSGVVLTYLATELGLTSSFFLALDINTLAAQATIKTARSNGASHLEAVVTDLFSALGTRLQVGSLTLQQRVYDDAQTKRVQQKVDVLLFNPPYVPTPSEEVGSRPVCLLTLSPYRDIAAAWAGGRDGREVIDRVLPLIDNLLSADGLFYMIVVEENKPLDIARIMKAQGFRTQRILRRRAHNEDLSVLKMSRLKGSLKEPKPS